MPRSRATCATGLPVSRASRTAPSLKSASNFLRVFLHRRPPLRRCKKTLQAETRRSSVPASVREGERRDTEVHPVLEGAHAEGAVQSGSRLGGYGELDVARDDGAVWAAGARE